jgi:adenylate cyclase
VARVFLSYAREDLEAAKAFAHAVGEAGHEVWWDHHLRPGSRFSWDIGAALKSAEAVVVLWSRASIESAWVQDEAAEGLEGSRLVPVMLDGTKPPLGFRQYHAIDMAGWRQGGAAFRGLAAAIDACVTGTPTSGPAAACKQPATQPTICVLPFANKSGDPEQDSFSDGITEDVITDLSKISALTTLGSNASFALKGQQVDLGKLGVTHAVEGAVRRAGSRLRISAQLIEASSGRSLWAERFDRELSDIFTIQDEISHAIVDALQLRLLPNEKTAIAEGRTNNAEAYDLYLKARRLWPDGAAGDYRKSEEIARLCTEATALDREYAGAWSLLALASAELRFWQARAVDALGPAERAMALDPKLAEPHCARARQLEESGRIGEAEAAVETALRLNPDSWEANREAACLLFRQGKAGAAVPLFEKAVALVRSDHGSASALVTCYRALGEQARAQHAAEMAALRAEKVIICDPANGIAFASAAHAFAELGDSDRARKWIRKAIAVDPGNLAMRYSLASTIAACFGEEEEALAVLEPFVEAARFAPHLTMLEFDPSWTPLRHGPGFEAALARMRARLAMLRAIPVSCGPSAAPSPELR